MKNTSYQINRFLDFWIGIRMLPILSNEVILNYILIPSQESFELLRYYFLKKELDPRLSRTPLFIRVCLLVSYKNYIQPRASKISEISILPVKNISLFLISIVPFQHIFTPSRQESKIFVK